MSRGFETPVIFIGKRFYTNRDALRECFGRIYQLPKHWAEFGVPTQLWLIDYHTHETVYERHGKLEISSTSLRRFSWLKQWRSITSRRRAGTTPKVIVASGDCYIALLGYWVARRLNARFVFDIYDKYDEFKGYRYLPGFDPFTFLRKQADQRMFASRALMQSLDEQSECDLFVPNGVNTQRFKARDMSESRNVFELSKDAIYVGYFGSMEPERGVDDLITAVQLLRKQGMAIELLLGGKRCRNLNPYQEGICYLGNLPFDHIPSALASCNLLALPYRRSLYLDMASSCKIAEYLACGRPIVSTRTPNLTANFPEQALQLSACLAAPNSPISLANAIQQQLAENMKATLPTRMTWEAISARAREKLGLGSI